MSVNVLLHILICGITFLLIYFFQFYFPVAYTYFAGEDSWVEYGTFACFLSAGIFILGAMKIDRSFKRPGYMLLCAALFFVALEEVSWGQRFFGVPTPHIIAQHNYQSEFTLHNASFFPSESLFSYAILVWAVIVPAIYSKFTFIHNFFNQAGVPVVLRWVQPYFVFGFILKNFDLLVKAGELGELMIGMGFVLFASDAFCKALNNARKPNITQGWIIGWSIFAILAMTFFLVQARPQKIHSLKIRLHLFAVSTYPEFGMYDQAKEIFQHIIAHKKFKNDDSLFQYGIFLKKIKNQEAETIFLKALQESRERMQLNPEKPAPNLLAGKIYKQLNQLDLAEKEFQEALKKDKTRLAKAELNWQKVDALKSLGETYLEMGKHELATEYLQKAFDYAEGGLAKAKIKNLLKTIDRPQEMGTK